MDVDDFYFRLAISNFNENIKKLKSIGFCATMTVDKSLSYADDVLDFIPIALNVNTLC